MRSERREEPQPNSFWKKPSAVAGSKPEVSATTAPSMSKLDEKDASAL